MPEDMPARIADALIASWPVSYDHHSQAMARQAAERDASTVWAEIGPELERLHSRVEHLRSRNAELQDLELGIKSLTTGSGSVDMSLHMAHDMMRILVAGFVKILDAEGGPNYAELMFKLRDSLDRYTLTIRRPDGQTPGEVASEQRRRAEQAEADLEAANHFLSQHGPLLHRAEIAEAERDTLKAARKEVAEAIRVASRIMTTSSRDWSLHAGDAWLWALLVGWDCEIAEHADGSHDEIDCGGPDRLEDFAERFGWTEGGIAKLRAQRRVLAALDHPTDTTGDTDGG